jgi:hypothetical protein
MKQNKPTVYLAGPIKNANNGGVGWRKEIKEEYSDKFSFNDPTEDIIVPNEDIDLVDGKTNSEDEISLQHVVLNDKGLLTTSDAVFVGYSDVKSVGTPMEVHKAYQLGLPIVMWDREPTGTWLKRQYKRLKTKVIGEKEKSLWYKHHTNLITKKKGEAVQKLYEII